MNIFVSHASDQDDIASAIALSLLGDGHRVFYDRSSLPAGETYDDQIREAIAGSDLVIFLISPQAIARGRYTLTELDLVEAKWPHPAGHVLPVLVEPTDLEEVPRYLKAVTLLEPRGNISASVAAAVARLNSPSPRRSRALWVAAALVAAAVVGLGSWLYVRDRQKAASLAALLESARVAEESGRYATALDQYTKAATLQPDDREAVLARQVTAMRWLENIRVTQGKETFTSIVERVEPVLIGCAASAEQVQAADCRAHLGWADFLRSREGNSDKDPVAQYRQALDHDSGNVYAHAMWGFEILRTGGSLKEAASHFSRALASGRERSFVRRLQLAGLLWRRDEPAEEELIRVATDMRRETGSSATPAVLEEDRWRLWNVYYMRLVNGHDRETFLAAVPPADHLATFDAVFPADQIPSDKRSLHAFMLGTLQEHAGDPGALATFQALHASLKREGALASGGRLPEGTEAALRRLSRPARTTGAR